MIITIDYETYYSKEYSLSRMTTVDYVLSPLFQTILCSIKIDDNKPYVAYGHERVAQALHDLPWDKAAMLSHNTMFDGAILSWIYGIVPKLYLDSLSMARALTHATIGRSSLKAVAEYLRLPAKGNEVYNNIGMRYEDFTQQRLHEYGDYSAHDSDLSKWIFNKFIRVFPKSELRVIDIALRMFIEPQAKLNPFVLAENLNMVRAEKAAALARVAHIDPKVFGSQKRFAELLEEYGVEVPVKISPTTGNEIPALAKNDEAFKELCDDEGQTPEVRALLAARVSAKSTIEETRSETLLNLSQQDWGAGKGAAWMPVPYRYYAAHTGRFGGTGGYNFTNLKRGSQLRHAIEAPPGMRIVHRDSSQIECRMVAFLARCWSLLTAFAQGKDVYSEFATEFYGTLITKADKPRRFVGKTCILGLDYGMSDKRLRKTLAIGAGGVSVVVSEDTSKDLVKFFRYKKFPEIPELWKKMEALIQELIRISGRRARSTVHEFDIPAIELAHESILLPNGLRICYPDIQNMVNMDSGVAEYVVAYKKGDHYRKTFGGATLENVSQALSRIVLTDAMIRVFDTTGYHPVLTTYDSLDYCVPASEAHAMDKLLEDEFAMRPAWAPELPLASEGGFGRTLLIAENETHPEHNQ